MWCCRVTSKYRGVRWHYCNSKWEARIFNGTRQVSLGYFDNEADAAAAYDAKARSLRGDAAVVNFPDGKATAGQAAAQKLSSKRGAPVAKAQDDDGDGEIACSGVTGRCIDVMHRPTLGVPLCVSCS